MEEWWECTNFLKKVNLFFLSNFYQVAFGGSSQKIHIYQKNIGGLIQEHKMEFLLGHLHSVINMKFWPDGSLLIVSSI